MVLAPLCALACDCAPVAEAGARADIVFVGRCINIATNPIKGDLNIVFQVDSSWKRAVEHVATVHTPTNDCNFAFTKGKRYLIYANKFHQTIKTTICEPNVLLAEGEGRTLPALGKTFLPGRPEFARKMNMLLIGLGVGGLVFMAIVVLRKRIFKPKA
jgi:hypothetical protein